MIGGGDCLCNRPAGVSFLEAMGQRVGISGAQELFRRWLQAGREPAELQAAEVLAGVRERNYVNSAAGGVYVEAVCGAYGSWRAHTQRAPAEDSDAQG